jgi:hypothetical protein
VGGKFAKKPTIHNTRHREKLKFNQFSHITQQRMHQIVTKKNVELKNNKSLVAQQTHSL